MNFLKSILRTKEDTIKSYADFWNWFQQNEEAFFKVVEQNGNLEKDFFEKLSSRLNEVKDGFYYLTGLFDKNTVELIFSAKGEIKNIVFIEELVNSAPQINGWRFTALKPAHDIADVNITMDGYEFNSENISFYANDYSGYPDEVEITIIHDNLDEENKSIIGNGTYIFLDIFLGELNFATTIDTLNIISKDNAQKELIPIEKLKDFLQWRQKEFIEKYEGLRHDTKNDNYSVLDAELESGNTLLAVINTDLLEWDSKASHPWILKIEIKYDGKDNKGMPNEKTYNFLNEIEIQIMEELKDFEGYLNIGRQTTKNVREVYFACKDFRKPSKVLYSIEQEYVGKLDLSYDIYKDKYWQSFNRFTNNN